MTTVRDVMTTDVRIVRPSSSLEQVARVLRDLDVGSVPVCDGVKLQGMITDRDIIVKAVAEGRDLSATKASELVEGTPVWIPVDADISEARRLMSENKIRRLPVIEDKRLVGIVSLGDLARADASTETAGTLRDVSAP